MDKPVLIVMCFFLIAGGLDYIFGSPLKLGVKFEEGFKAMGPLALGIIGIYSISPFLLVILGPAVHAFSVFLHIDPSILPACIFPVDMGGYQISRNLAENEAIGRFSGIIIASTLGATISFSIPVACRFISKADNEFFAKGVVIGIISIVPGCFFAGLLSGLAFFPLLWNMIPLFVIVLLLSIGLVRLPGMTLKGFIIFGKILSALGVLGILFQGLDVILGIKVIPTLVPFTDTVFLVGKITLILAGAYPMMEVLNRLLKRRFEKIGRVLGVNAHAISAGIGNLASNLLVFGDLQNMDRKGKVLCSSLAVSAAFVLGGQFAYVATVEPAMVGPFFLSKCISGIICILIILYLPVRKKSRVDVPQENMQNTEAI
ncbi:MAG: ethanolamine utilization protein EutH [Eubacteriales bacterium]